MGVYITDHRDSDQIPRELRTLNEMETRSCKHCQKVIRVVLRGCTKLPESPYRCTRCHSAICKECAGIMEKIGQCPGPFLARVEAELRKGQRMDDFMHAYRSCAT